jgi:hypothetical protein
VIVEQLVVEQLCSVISFILLNFFFNDVIILSIFYQEKEGN